MSLLDCTINKGCLIKLLDTGENLSGLIVNCNVCNGFNSQILFEKNKKKKKEISNYILPS